jgi:hypothetical protein
MDMIGLIAKPKLLAKQNMLENIITEKEVHIR